METIILITVLATLGVVALVTAIVVAFVKLSKKVDVNDFDRENENIYNEMEKKYEKLNKDLEYHVTAIYQQMNDENEDIRRFVDSRCDKLDTKIKNLNNNMPESKQLLTD